MIGLLQKGLEFFTGLTGDDEKGFNALQWAVGEMDRRRDIDYGRKQVEVKNYEELTSLIADGVAVRQRVGRRIKSDGVYDDGYKRTE